MDYLGIFDDKSVKQVVSNIQELKDVPPEVVQKCVAFFHGADRNLKGYEGLIAVQQCLPNSAVRDSFGAAFSFLSRIWEILSPDPVLGPFEADYKMALANLPVRPAVKRTRQAHLAFFGRQDHRVDSSERACRCDSRWPWRFDVESFGSLQFGHEKDRQSAR